jgi:cell filamentation protein
VIEHNDPYVYPGSNVLRNCFGITDSATLAETEREVVLQRIDEGAPSGNFDLAHLQAIHHHLFQDVYDWAGELRSVEIAKGSSHFLHASRIEMGMADVHRRLEAQTYLRALSRQDYAAAAAQIIGDVNYVHPFREGNGRTQLEYLRQLTEQAGHVLHPTALDSARWISASKASHDGDYAPMREEILSAIGGRRGSSR